MHRGHEILDEIARLGLRLEVIQEERRRVAEGLLEVDALARAGCHLLAAGGEVFLERLGVARELRAQLVDLTTEILRLRVLHAGLCLTLGERLAARIEERSRSARALEDRTKRGGRSALLRGLIGLRPRRCARALGDLHELAELRGLLLLGRSLAKRARLLVCELLDLTTDLGAKRAPAALERLELARVAGYLALEPRGPRSEVPDLRETRLDLGRHIACRIHATHHA